jgi:hypothetical protein
MTDLRRADPAARRQAVLFLVVAALIGALVIVAFERYRIHSATGSWPTPEHRRIASSRFSCWLLLSY